MRKYAIIPPGMWVGELGRQLRAGGQDAQILSLYLLSGPGSNMIGLYYISLAAAAAETGLPAERLRHALSYLISIDYCIFDEKNEIIWVVNAVLSQISDKPLKSNDNRSKGVARALESLPNTPLVEKFIDFWGAHLGLTAHPEQDQGQEQKQDQGQEQKQDQGQEQSRSRSSTPSEPLARGSEEALKPLASPLPTLSTDLIDEVALIAAASPSDEEKFRKEISSLENWQIVGGLRRYLARRDHAAGKGLAYALAICRRISRAEIDGESQGPQPRTYAQCKDAERRQGAAKVFELMQEG